MKPGRVLGWTALGIPLVLFVAVFVAYWMSDNTCVDPNAAPANPMQAIGYCDYGTSEVLQLLEIAKPTPQQRESPAVTVPTDIIEDTIREICLPLGFVDTKVCAGDDIWSGLKLVVRKELR